MQPLLKKSIYRLLAIAVVLSLAAGTVALRAEPEGNAECPIEKAVTTLLSSWEVAGAEAKALGAAERADLEKRIAGLSKECPVGSRLGATFVSVRDVLAAAISSTEENAEHCPIEKAEKANPESASCAEAKKLKEARTKALRHLHRLASYGAEAAPASACCATSEPAKTVAASAAKAAKAANAPKSESCPGTRTIELAVRVGALQASWRTAGQEVASIPAATQRERLAGMQQLAQRSKAVGLVPPTVIALADGFDALDAVHGKMIEWATAHPDVLESVPAEVRRAFAEEVALIRETGEVLSAARSALKAAMASCAEHDEKVETAARS